MDELKPWEFAVLVGAVFMTLVRLFCFLPTRKWLKFICGGD